MLALEHRLAPNYGLSEECDRAFTLSPRCRTSDQPEILIWGDSFAMHLVPGVLASNPKARLIQFTLSMCGPLLGLAPLTNADEVGSPGNCIRANDRVFAYLQRSKTIKYVVLGSMFEQYFGKGNKVLLRDGSVTDNDDVAMRSFERTLARIRSLGMKPVIFGPTPRTGKDMGRCVLRASFFHLPTSNCDLPFTLAQKRQAPTFTMLDQVSRSNQVIRLDASLCHDGICHAEQNGVLLYRDDGHLSIEGSSALGRAMGWYGLIVGRDLPQGQTKTKL
jgi:hypothetical protein